MTARDRSLGHAEGTATARDPHLGETSCWDDLTEEEQDSRLIQERHLQPPLMITCRR
jgi:hypothetical protein